MDIYVWGTGCGASQAIENGLPLSLITGFIDSCPSGETFLGKPVFLPRELESRPVDLILCANRHGQAVRETCLALGIGEDKILYLKEPHILQDRNSLCTAGEKLLGKDILSRLLPPQHIVTAPSSLQNPILTGQNDYVRISTLELLSRQLDRVPGALAELGVYRGAFAACMNQLMPERTLYLFDSFQGFDPLEARREQGRNTCGESFLAAHRNTCAQQVAACMPYPERVVLKPGFFPESLEGLEDTFALVSLDVDFRDTTLEGLRYFWPRLAPGGYLMLHDWGSPTLTGVREAASIFERELSQDLPAVPIPDIGNSLILYKVRNI